MDRVEVVPIRDSNLVEVSFDSSDRELAARGANAIVDEYVRLSARLKLRSTSGAKSLLEGEIGNAKARLEKSERELNDLARRYSITDIEDSTDLVASRVAELSSELTRVVSERIEAEAVYRQVWGQKRTEVSKILENDLIQTLRDRHARLSSEYARLSRMFHRSYPKLQQLKAEMSQVISTLEREKMRVASSIKAEFERIGRSEQLVRAELDKEKAALVAIKDRAVDYHMLKREWETNRDLYVSLLQQTKEAGVAAGMAMTNVAIIDRAKVPFDAHSPDILLNLGGALGLGLAIGLTLAFTLGYLDDVVRTPREFEAVTGLTPLGTVPKGNVVDFESAKSLSSTPLRNGDPVSEAFRTLRVHLRVAWRASQRRTLLVTSALPGEGKTTMAVCLSAMLAQSGSRVLLVDGDLRRPRVHDLFGVPRTPGLSELLEGGADDCIKATEIPNLAVLPAGDLPEDPGQLLGSVRMDALLERLRATFDFVIVDSAPVLSLADSVVTATKVDGVLLVTAADRTRSGAVREAVKQLQAVRAPLLGGVLNMADLRRHTPGYGRYEYYGYADA